MFVYFGGHSGFMSADFVPSYDLGLETDILVYCVFCFFFPGLTTRNDGANTEKHGENKTDHNSIRRLYERLDPSSLLIIFATAKRRHDARFFPARSVSGSSYETHHGP